ncbi:hypothetical protein [Flavobacterium beibuense]|uniref:hypothetical protein n=1 Tax=Flavobacterium beibuense TaxID=657326 RepID=UPI00068E9988|nr:hypothetical protein [Flavobacterium beibuense]
MKPQIKYIELKSGYSDNGPAWIGLVTFSKTGRTVYFNGKAFKSLKAKGISGNHYDLETGEEYLTIINRDELNLSKYTITEVITNDIKEQAYLVENEQEEEETFTREMLFKNPKELSNSELKSGIDYLKEKETVIKYNKARRGYKETRITFEEELTKRMRQ